MYNCYLSDTFLLAGTWPLQDSDVDINYTHSPKFKKKKIREEELWGGENTSRISPCVISFDQRQRWSDKAMEGRLRPH